MKGMGRVYKRYAPAALSKSREALGQVGGSGDLEADIGLCAQQTLEPAFMKYLSREGRILEAGAGRGRWVFYLRRRGYDVVGMTNLGEAKCCREAEIAYATMAMITDYDCWKDDEAHVTVEMVIANLTRNAETAKAIVAKAIPQIPEEPNWPCHSALRNAILTDKKLWPAKTKRRLQPLLQKYL